MTRATNIFIGSVLFTVLFTAGFYGITSITHNQNSQEILPKDNINLSDLLYPEQNEYNADIHSIETNVTINSKGRGVVSMQVNCTALAGHIGIYLKNFEDQASFNLDECYALTDDEQIDINFTLVNQLELAYLIYLENSSKVSVGENVVYYINYESNFYLNEQIYRFQVDSSLAAINLIRPIWDDDLLYQTLKVTLPVEVADETISPQLLEDIRFELADIIIDNYNVSYIGKEDNEGNYWLTIEFEKEDLIEDASFQAFFYLSMDYFSFPMMINWFVILLLTLTGLLTVALFIVIISFQKKAKTELEEFKDDLYKVLQKQEIE